MNDQTTTNSGPNSALGEMIYREGSMGKRENAFNGCKVFSATMIHQRVALGEAITAWLEEAKARRPGFQLVDIVVRQSSDDGFHCVSACLFFKEGAAKTTGDKRRG